MLTWNKYMKHKNVFAKHKTSVNSIRGCPLWRICL